MAPRPDAAGWIVVVSVANGDFGACGEGLIPVVADGDGPEGIISVRTRRFLIEVQEARRDQLFQLGGWDRVQRGDKPLGFQRQRNPCLLEQRCDILAVDRIAALGRQRKAHGTAFDAGGDAVAIDLDGEIHKIFAIRIFGKVGASMHQFQQPDGRQRKDNFAGDIIVRGVGENIRNFDFVWADEEVLGLHRHLFVLRELEAVRADPPESVVGVCGRNRGEQRGAKQECGFHCLTLTVPEHISPSCPPSIHTWSALMRS